MANTSEPIIRDVLREELGVYQRRVDEQFTDFGKRVDEQFNQFGFKIFAYLDKRFDEVNKRIDVLDEKYDKLLTTLDAFLKRLDDIEKENLARDHEMERIKRWVEQIARKTGVKLEY